MRLAFWRRSVVGLLLVTTGAVAGRAGLGPLDTGVQAAARSLHHTVAGLAPARKAGARPAGTVLSVGRSFALTPLEQQFVTTSRNVAREVVQVENTGNGLGSGVIATTDGYIVTNNHVVDKGTRFFVTLSNGKRFPARLVGTSPTDDLAVLKIGQTGLPAAQFGNSERLLVGQEVLAIGNPLGLGETVTSGVVSALARTVSEGPGAYLPHAIQTSAAINPGNSGGALVSLDGQVVGIPTLGVSSPLGGSAQGIGFAIPSSRVVTIVNQLITQGRVTHTGRAYLGIFTQDAAQTDQSNPFQPSQQVSATGVVAVQVGSSSPAARGGLQQGDIIVSLAGRPVQNSDTLFAILSDLHVGQTVTMGVQRPDQTSGALHGLHLRVTLGELPSNTQG